MAKRRIRAQRSQLCPLWVVGRSAMELNNARGPSFFRLAGPCVLVRTMALLFRRVSYGRAGPPIMTSLTPGLYAGGKQLPKNPNSLQWPQERYNRAPVASVRHLLDQCYASFRLTRVRDRQDRRTPALRSRRSTKPPFLLCPSGPCRQSEDRRGLLQLTCPRDSKLTLPNTEGKRLMKLVLEVPKGRFDRRKNVEWAVEKASDDDGKRMN